MLKSDDTAFVIITIVISQDDIVYGSNERTFQNRSKKGSRRSDGKKFRIFLGREPNRKMRKISNLQKMYEK